MPLHLTLATSRRLAHIITTLDTHTLKALNHPSAQLHHDPRTNRYGILAPSTDPDTVHDIPYLHYIPEALYQSLKRTQSNTHTNQ